MSPDPGPLILLNLQAYNAYTYGLDNPLRYADDGGETPQGKVDAANHFAAMDIAYLSGGENPLCDLDCSGLVQNVFKANPDNTIHALDTVLDAADQAAELQKYGQYSTNINDARPGDAIFFADPRTAHIVHTGIAVDVENETLYFVDAPNPKRLVGKDHMLMKHVYWEVKGSQALEGPPRTSNRTSAKVKINPKGQMRLL